MGIVDSLGGLYRIPVRDDGTFGPVEAVARGVGVFGDGLDFDRLGNLYVIFDTVKDFALDETVVFARPGHAIPEPTAASRAYLVVQTDGGSAARFDLGGALIAVGRADDNDVIVDDPQVSRHHCQLKLQHGAYSFADLGSRNGSSVNGQPVSQIALGPGDIIRIGDTEIEFQVRA